MVGVGAVASAACSSVLVGLLPGAFAFAVVLASDPAGLLPAAAVVAVVVVVVVVVSPVGLLLGAVLVPAVAPSEPLVRLFRFFTSLRSVADSASMNMSDSTKASKSKNVWRAIENKTSVY